MNGFDANTLAKLMVDIATRDDEDRLGHDLASTETALANLVESAPEGSLRNWAKQAASELSDVTNAMGAELEHRAAIEAEAIKRSWSRTQSNGSGISR